MKTYEEITKFLEQPIPREEVSTRKQSGFSLSYLETWKVIDLLNEAFGNLGWDSETVENYQVNSSYSKDKDAPAEKPIYVAKVRIKALVKVGDGQFLNIVKEGTGYGIDKSGLNPHEMASKEAESDALKRAAMKFGKRLGLALYDKTQEFVSDEKTEDKARESSTTQPTTPNTVGGVRGEPKTPVPTARPNRETVLKSISAASKVVVDKKVKTLPELKALLAAYGVESKEHLSDEQAEKFLGELKTLLK